MAQVFYERKHPGEFLVSEGNGAISRENIVVTGGDIEACTVLGQITESGLYAALDPAADDGREIAAAILWGHADASDADVGAVAIVRFAEVNGEVIGWPEDMAPADLAVQIDALKENGVIVR